MKNFFHLIRYHAYSHLDMVLFLLSAFISYGAILFFYFHGNQNLANYDAIARLNIARKMIDSITPGFGQLGGIWLPFPQILLVPFIGNDFFWHTGVAGALVSGIAFVYAALYLQKTAFFLTKSVKASLLVWFIFVTNSNILLLQTMALSESFFLFCLIMVMYFLTKWTKTHDMIHFLSAALFLVLITLTRYEGYFVFIASVLVVLIDCIITYRREGISRIEGMLLLFLTVAGFGIFLWCIYCALFYKDPLYWLHVYSTTNVVSTRVHPVSSHTSFARNIPQTPLLTSLSLYSQVIFWTNGVITVMVGILGMVLMLSSFIWRLLKRQSVSIYLPLLCVSVLSYGLLIYGYHIGFIPHIAFPPKLLPQTLLTTFSTYEDSNIRYGVILLPCILLFVGFAASRNRILFSGSLFLIAFQLFMNITQPQLLQYSFASTWRYPLYTEASWFHTHYDTGLVLISANRHEDFMFQSGLPYKDFIYEGSRQYWTTSLNNPARYATWVVYDDSIREDGVHDFSTQNAQNILQKQFTLVYDDLGFKIFHLQSK